MGRLAGIAAITRLTVALAIVDLTTVAAAGVIAARHRAIFPAALAVLLAPDPFAAVVAVIAAAIGIVLRCEPRRRSPRSASCAVAGSGLADRKSNRLNSSHSCAH